MNKRAVIIQARNGSSRFPNKMIYNIDNKGTLVFDFLLKRLKAIFTDNEVFLATTDLVQDDSLCRIAGDNNILYFRGSESNVLDRFIKCAEYYRVNEIIRLCADNPFIDLEDLTKLKNIDLTKLDYISFNIKGNPSIKTHYGFWAELVSLNALKRVQSLTSETLYLEHVTNFIYENLNEFNIELIETSISNRILNENIRLTLDTEEDLNSIKFIINELNMLPQEIKVNDVYKLIKNRTDVLDSMSIQIRRNSK